MQHMINSLASAQATGTQQTIAATHHFLNYCATHPSAFIRYHASDMILWVHSDASYLSEPQARSRYGGHHFLGDTTDTKLNGPILALVKILRHFMSSAA